MEYVIVNIFLPAGDVQYDVRIPLDVNVHAGVKLIADAISRLCAESYLPSRSSFLAKRGNGTMLNPEKTFRECGIQYGSELILI